MADEAALKLFYQVKLKAICEQLKMPSKVLVRCREILMKLMLSLCFQKHGLAGLPGP